MALELELAPVIVEDLPHLSITCLDIFTGPKSESKLLIGTVGLGVVVLDVILASNAYKASVESIRNCEVYVQPINQLTLVDTSSNLLLVLSGGQVVVFKIDIAQPKMQFQVHQILPEFNVQQYSSCGSSLGLYTIKHFFIYKRKGTQFEKVIDFATDSIVINDFLMTSSIMYLVHNKDAIFVSCSSFNTSTNEFSYELLNSYKLDLLGYFGVDQVLLQNNFFVSSIVEKNKLKPTLYWNIKPTAIVTMKNHCIGISSSTIEIVTFHSSGVRARKSFDIKGPLRYITSKSSSIYVATSESIYRLLTPIEMEPIPISPPLETTPSYEPLTFSFAPISCSPPSPRQATSFHEDNIEKIKELTLPNDFSPQALLKGKHIEAKKRTDMIIQNADPNPEDPLEVIGMNIDQINFLASFMIFTIRQFAQMSRNEVSPELKEFYEAATRIVSNRTKSNFKYIKSETVYGYVYLSPSEYTNAVEYREIKSPYVLFQEYMELEPELRFEHPWVEVYNQYRSVVQKDMKCTNVSDADVFSWLCWAHIGTIGKTDYTAGARAIPMFLKQRVVKFSQVVRIDLSALCNNTGAKLYYTNSPKWEEITLEQFAKRRSHPEDYLKGCIVLPSGTITWNFVSEVFRVPE